MNKIQLLKSHFLLSGFCVTYLYLLTLWAYWFKINSISNLENGVKFYVKKTIYIGIGNGRPSGQDL